VIVEVFFVRAIHPREHLLSWFLLIWILLVGIGDFIFGLVLLLYTEQWFFTIPFSLAVLFAFFAILFVLPMVRASHNGESCYCKFVGFLIFMILAIVINAFAIYGGHFLLSYFELPILGIPSNVPLFGGIKAGVICTWISDIVGVILIIVSLVLVCSPGVLYGPEKKKKPADKKNQASIPLSSVTAKSAVEEEEEEEGLKSESIESECEKASNNGNLAVSVILIVFGLLAIAGFIGGIVSLIITFGTSDPCSSWNDTSCYNHCEPNGAGGCLLPWPSSYYLVKDSSTVTGYRVNIPSTATPLLRTSTRRISTKWINELDGFSITSPLLFDIPSAKELVFDKDGLVSTINRLENDTLYPDKANIVIIEADSKYVVPQFAEIDVFGASFGERPMVVVNLGEPLKFNKRYIVAVSGMYDNSTKKVAPAVEGFGDILFDQKSSEYKYLTTEVIPIIHSVTGWTQYDLQLAWDFRTMSEEFALSRIEALYDDAMKHESRWEVTKVEKVSNCPKNPAHSEDYIAKRIWGTFTVPSYFEGRNQMRGSPFKYHVGNYRDEKIKVAPTGEVLGEFIAEIPCSVLEGNDIANQTIQVGHTFFKSIGRTNLLNINGLRYIASKIGSITMATDWFGMSTVDILEFFRNTLVNPGRIAFQRDTLQQGFIMQGVLNKLIHEEFGRHSAFQDKNGKTLIDIGTDRSYIGVSQGSILGISFSALSKDITKGVYVVPAVSFPMILCRSELYTLFSIISNTVVYSFRDLRLFLSIEGTVIETGEGAGYIWKLREQAHSPKTNEGAKTLLFQSAINDQTLTEYSAHMLYRGLNASTSMNAVRHIPFVNEINFSSSTGVTTPTMFEFLIKEAKNISANNTPVFDDEYNPHELLYYQSDTRDYILSFFESGVITEECTISSGNNSCILDLKNNSKAPKK